MASVYVWGSYRWRKKLLSVAKINCPHNDQLSCFTLLTQPVKSSLCFLKEHLTLWGRNILYSLKSASKTENREDSLCLDKSTDYQWLSGQVAIRQAEWLDFLIRKLTFLGALLLRYEVGLTNTCHKSYLWKLILKILRLTITGLEENEWILFKGATDDRRKSVQAVQRVSVLSENQTHFVFYCFMWPQTNAMPSLLFLSVVSSVLFLKCHCLGMDAHTIFNIFSWYNSLLKVLACVF